MIIFKDMQKLLRFKHNEMRRLLELRGLKRQSDLARAVGMSPQQLNEILRRDDIAGVTLGTVDKICEALSSPSARLRLDDLVEYVPDP